MADNEGESVAMASSSAQNETEEDMRARHRKEVKDLAGRTTSLKKSVGKGASSAKKKKEVLEEIAKLEQELESRHESELNALLASSSSLSKPDEQPIAEPDADLESRMDNLQVSPDAPSASESRSKKPNRQQLRKEKKQAKFEEDRAQALKEAADAPNLREVEDAAISKALQPMGLTIKHIMPDGHCLYNAISDQMAWRREDSAVPAADMRRTAASYLRTHQDAFAPFLLSDEGEMMTEGEFQQYCDDIEQKPVWGGQLEIQAISAALSRPIHVVQMNQPVMVIGEEFASFEPLIIS
ncbi:hypothetical protein SmJEL517_g03816 [Synchytrium microbalum]|uniref:OTU domain-containing protein n=1 Tax=Synchytrium microbalum TaxID=1806994 RepID=A0A507C1D5_9FUNG|nr:uncharacterized protein SmJEL517_g03816 [Synchytrium microbalum]TPX33178.1 hypothetical protein SmJEL517_g03816 [Synchytrium microbalum]